MGIRERARTSRRTETELEPRRPARAVSRLGILVSLALLIGLLVFSLKHAGEARRFGLLLERAEPWWVALAVALQVATYVCAGAIWGAVARASGHPLSKMHLARLAIEKLGVDQFVPAGGMAGNVVVVSALRRMGVPPGVATQALLIDIFSHYAAFACVAGLALVVLRAHHGVTPAVVGLLSAFALFVTIVPLSLIWFLRGTNARPVARRKRPRFVSRVLAAFEGVSLEQVWKPRLLTGATLLQAGIFLLDAGTLWAMLKSLSAEAHVLTAFVAVVIASIAGTLSLLPGGLGSFEAGSTATLALLGVPIEAALTATFLLRGLTLWLPLLPGILLARRDLAAAKSAESDRAELTKPDAPLAELFERLATGPDGLTSAEAAARLARSGPNTVEPTTSRTALGELVRAVVSPLPLILLVAAAASAFLGQVADAAIITAMVGLSAGINFWQSSRSARAVRNLQARVTPTATVLRDGAWLTIARKDVVPGDLIQLTAGDLVPADARLIQSTDLHVQQAALTGESLPVEKAAGEQRLERAGPEAPELVFVGTSVVSGIATAVVFATGGRTAFGDIAARLAARPEETEFERGSRRFGVLILQTVTFLVLAILIFSIAMGRDAFQSLLFAVALAVGLTPEYLPMITTVTLAQGAARMARHKVIVKHLASIQNLGSIDVLCSDKTGTLTTGTMTLDASLDALGQTSERALHLAHLNSAFQTGVKGGLDAAILESSPAGTEGYRKVAEVPFDFERRRLSVVVEDGRQTLLISKGAPESLLSCCTHLELGAETRQLDNEALHACRQLFDGLSADGYRVLAVAYRKLDAAERPGRELERDLVLAGFLSFADQLLEGAAEAVSSLRNDGVRVKILSGDNELVTRTLCRKVGMDVARVVTGETLGPLDEPALARVAEDADVFARISPAQKHRIVMALKRSGHVVGFLGDGINDAPSLHGADVGISVAGAVDVAQEASDILLLEKRLDVLHAGIVAGRRSFANVLKYLLMGTSSNFGNMLSMAVAVFFLPFLPMLPTQILVNNFLYDSAQITIPTDRVDVAYLRGPQRWNIGVIRRFMLLIGPLSSLFDFLTFAVLLLVFRFGESAFQTGWFIESLSTQILVLFVIRTTGRPWSDRPSLALAVTALAALACGVALPYSPLAAPLGMTPLPATYLLFVAVVVPSYLTLVELVKARLIRRIVPEPVPAP